jgi:hypothetical protein
MGGKECATPLWGEAEFFVQSLKIGYASFCFSLVQTLYDL